jgi:enoyl-CoA hydratase
MMFTNVEIFEPGDGVSMIRLAGPVDRHNSIDSSFLLDLHGAIDHLRKRTGVKVIVFIGKGRTFSVGADLDEIRDSGEEEVRRFLRAGQALIRQIMELDILTVAAINGLALGGGLELALACDLRWAHRRAVVALPEAKLGILPGWGGGSLLGRLIPDQVSAELIKTGNSITSRRARETGLVDRLIDSEEFETTLLHELAILADQGYEGLREIKNGVRSRRREVELTTCDSAFLALWNERRAKNKTMSSTQASNSDRQQKGP